MAFSQGHALVVGIGSYPHESWLDVPQTVADAQAVADVLRDPTYCGYPPDQVTLLHDETATRDGILAALAALAKNTTPDDTALLFYCGHGVLDGQRNFYLTAHDYTESDPPQGAISQQELLAALRAVPARRTLLIFNACHAGAVSPSLAAQPAGGPQRLGEPLPDTTVQALLATGSGRIIITACKEDQSSYLGAGERTIFTQALVEALRGRGISSSHGYIGAYDLYEAVYATVGETVERQLHQRQEPELTVLKGIGPFAVALFRGATRLGSVDERQPLPEGTAAREIKPEVSQRMFQRISNITVTAGERGVAAGRDITGSTIITGDQNHIGDEIHAERSQGFLNRPTGPVEQHFGREINTGGGAFIGGNVQARDFVGRDKIVQGDEVRGDKVQGDKVGGDKIDVGNITGSTGVAIGRGAQAHVTQSQGATPGDFAAFLAELRRTLDAAPFDDRTRRRVSGEIADIEEEAQEPQPDRSYIEDKLRSVESLIQRAAGVGVAATGLLATVQKGVELAQRMFQ